jgi:rhamnopyranosyl-N-acetylglucosaminyl-diphospho-decaprenol beta-1,3/1,4-galactofuranosyltransferase
MEKVIAVIVTYNRQRLLSECIDALKNQSRPVDKILVINNGSNDNTESWLKNQAGLDYFTQKNVGSGGGFYTGIKLAYERGYDWIWLMDDDGYPKENALENLLEGDDEKLCLRNCAVINKDDKKSFVWKTGNYNNIDEVKDTVIKNFAHPFNGTLLHKKIIEKVGLPKKELFIWGDETEYYHRIISKNKIPFYTKANSIHYHPAAVYSYKNDWDFNSNWKMYFYVRNRFHILKTRFSKSFLVAFCMYLGFLITFSGIILLFQKTNKIKKIRFLAWPVIHAFTNNCNTTPAMILKRLSTPKRSPSGNYTLHPIKLFKIIFSQPAIPTLQHWKKA